MLPPGIKGLKSIQSKGLFQSWFPGPGRITTLGFNVKSPAFNIVMRRIGFLIINGGLEAVNHLRKTLCLRCLTRF